MTLNCFIMQMQKHIRVKSHCAFLSYWVQQFIKWPTRPQFKEEGGCSKSLDESEMAERVQDSHNTVTKHRLYIEMFVYVGGVGPGAVSGVRCGPAHWSVSLRCGLHPAKMLGPASSVRGDQRCPEGQESTSAQSHGATSVSGEGRHMLS